MDYSVNENTRICSNHFKFGRPTNVDPHPTLYLKGYDEQRIKRKLPTERSNVPLPSPECSTRKRPRLETDKVVQTSTETCDVSESVSPFEMKNCGHMTGPHSIQVSSEQDEIAALKQENEVLKEKIKDLESRVTLKFENIKHSDALVKVYTGSSSSKTFYFILDKVRPHSAKLHYYRGQVSHKSKKYQHSPSKVGCQTKPGPERQLSFENEILITLMRIRLDLKIDDLAFRFGISSPHASNIITTTHFTGNLTKVEGIIDCTEQKISKPSLSKAQYQTFSTHKSSNTLKKLVVCTKSGSFSYISPSFGGCASDRYITEQCQISDKFHPGMIALVDRGFNVQDNFPSRQVRVVFPPFKGKTARLSKE